MQRANISNTEAVELEEHYCISEINKLKRKNREVMISSSDEEVVKKKKKKWKKPPKKGSEDAFNALPNELLTEILLRQLDPMWHIVCKSVCRLWRLLLAQNPSSSHPTATEYATTLARGGHLNVLQWARSQGCPWDKWTCAFAAEAGNLEMLQRAHSQGCPWDEDTCARAAGGGHLEIVQWARSQGCPWNKWTQLLVFAIQRF